MCYRRTATKAENHDSLFYCIGYIWSNSLNQYFYLYNVDKLTLWEFLRGIRICMLRCVFVRACDGLEEWKRLVSNVFEQNVGQDCLFVCVCLSLRGAGIKSCFLVALFSWYMILYHADGWKCDCKNGLVRFNSEVKSSTGKAIGRSDYRLCDFVHSHRLSSALYCQVKGWQKELTKIITFSVWTMENGENQTNIVGSIVTSRRVFHNIG